MKLTDLKCSHGAPMGRREIYLADNYLPISIELEKVPFIDGAYDVGGAYFGAPDDLYCAIGTLDGEVLLETFLRASNREAAIVELQAKYPAATFQKENGSLYEQAIEVLKLYIDKEEDEDCVESAEFELEVFQDRLREIRKANPCPNAS